MSLYTRQTGTGSPVVLLHGWGMNAAVWQSLLPTLERHHTVTVVELPGHGASAAARHADLADWARLCSAAVPDGAHWVGWSLGALVALRAALDNPYRINGLTLIAATPCFVQRDDWQCAMAADTFAGFADALGGDARATLARFLSLQVRNDVKGRGTLKTLRAGLSARPAPSAAGLGQGLALLLRSDLRAELADLRCPVHWLLGERDTLVPKDLAVRLEAAIPPARVTLVDGAAHALHISHPGTVLNALAAEAG